jgi:hypothetical protein
MQAHIEPPPSLWAYAAMPRSQLLHRIPDSWCLNDCFRFDRACVPNSVSRYALLVLQSQVTVGREDTDAQASISTRWKDTEVGL